MLSVLNWTVIYTNLGSSALEVSRRCAIYIAFLLTYFTYLDAWIYKYITDKTDVQIFTLFIIVGTWTVVIN